MKKLKTGIFIALCAVVSQQSVGQVLNYQQYNVLNGNCLLPGSGCTATNTGEFIRNTSFSDPLKLQGLSFYIGNSEKISIKSNQTTIQNGLVLFGTYYSYGSNFLKGDINLFAKEGNGLNGTACIQAYDFGTTSNIDLQFRTKKGSSVLDVLRLTQDGNVGIGINNSLKGKLVVNGQIGNTSAVFGSKNPLIAVCDVPCLGFNTYFNGGWKSYTGGAYTGVIFLNSTTGDLGFCTGNNPAQDQNAVITERITIKNNGNVGIGTTIPDKGKLHLRGSFHVENEDGSAQVFHVSAGKQLVFVGDSAYIMYNKAVLNGEKNFDQSKFPYYNKYSLWVSHGIVTEDIVLAKPHQWDDYVFNDDYKLQSLPELEKFVKTNKHLPNMPSESELKQNGYAMHQMNRNMVKTLEELTLHVIEQEKNISGLNEQVKQKDEQIQELKSQLDQVKTMAKDIDTLKAMIITDNNKHLFE